MQLNVENTEQSAEAGDIIRFTYPRSGDTFPVSVERKEIVITKIIPGYVEGEYTPSNIGGDKGEYRKFIIGRMGRIELIQKAEHNITDQTFRDLIGNKLSLKISGKELFSVLTNLRKDDKISDQAVAELFGEDAAKLIGAYYQLINLLE